MKKNQRNEDNLQNAYEPNICHLPSTKMNQKLVKDKKIFGQAQIIETVKIIVLNYRELVKNYWEKRFVNLCSNL